MEGFLPKKGKSVGSIVESFSKAVVFKGADQFTKSTYTDNHYTEIPRALLRLKAIAASEKIVYCALLYFARQDSVAFPKNKDIAAILSMSEPTVKRSLHELRNNRLVETKRGRRGNLSINLNSGKFCQNSEIRLSFPLAYRIFGKKISKTKSLPPILFYAKQRGYGYFGRHYA